MFDIPTTFDGLVIDRQTRLPLKYSYMYIKDKYPFKKLIWKFYELFMN